MKYAIINLMGRRTCNNQIGFTKTRGPCIFVCLSNDYSSEICVANIRDPKVSIFFIFALNF
jgi:hypothetical protein